jgi:hypothetical protein
LASTPARVFLGIIKPKTIIIGPEAKTLKNQIGPMLKKKKEKNIIKAPIMMYGILMFLGLPAKYFFSVTLYILSSSSSFILMSSAFIFDKIISFSFPKILFNNSF